MPNPIPNRTLSRILFGDPLRSSQEHQERLSKTKALAVFSSDALSSVAYATEEILRVLILAGAAALWLSTPIAVVIVLLLAIVATSYYQTIHGYPSGGGAYIVAKDNLNETAGLVAAAALLVDYVLTVAVSITAGVTAIHSAFPELHEHRIAIALVMIALVTWANLRGLRESGTLFSVPTYLFVVMVLTLLVVGGARIATGSLTPAELPAGAAPSASAPGLLTGHIQFVGVLLILRAFASGCTAMTGVEAISNGIPAFRPPESTNAGKTLVAMALLLGLMFLGITLLARYLALVPSDQQSILSLLGRGVFGDGVAYYVLQLSTTLILTLAANTSYADFPRLASLLARSDYLPRQLANIGDRLVFSNGILCLALLASVLVIVFEGRTHLLIPLYAVGVFLSFTLSQLGMVRHWQRVRAGHWRVKAIVNGLGGVTSAVVLAIIVESKFLQGAWIVCVLIPLIVVGLRRVRRYYAYVQKRVVISPEAFVAEHALDPGDARHKVVVPIAGFNRATLAAATFARSLSRDVLAVLVNIDPEKTRAIEDSWRIALPEVPLVVLESPYRSVIEPVVEFLGQVDRRQPERGLAVVVIPEILPSRWWHNLFHNQTAFFLKNNLLYRSDRLRTDRIIINVPYHLGR